MHRRRLTIYITMSVLFCLLTAVVMLPIDPAGVQAGDEPREGDENPLSTSNKPAHLIVCGGDEVFIVEVDESKLAKQDPAKHKRLFVWRAEGRADVPRRLRLSFKTTVECTPVKNGELIFITSKEGGVALVERRTGKPRFATLVHARAYAGDLLPNDRAVVVGGTGKEGFIHLYDMNSDEPDKPVYQDDLLYAHGVYYDAKAKLVWAVGWSELRAYRLKDWDGDKPKLGLVESYDLPGESGHDLTPNPGTRELFVTMHDGVWLFDLETRKFRRHPTLGSYTHVKSISVHPETGRLAYVKAEEKTWWTREVKLWGLEDSVRFANKRVYKARWYSN